MRYLIGLTLLLSACGEPEAGPQVPTLIGEIDLTTADNQYGARYPSVIKDPSTGIYRMYHLVEKTAPVKHLYYAESSDGLHFTPKGEIKFTDEKLYGAEVTYDTHSKQYILAFHTNRGTESQSIDFSNWESKLAYSKDGLAWQVDEQNRFRPDSTVSDAPSLPIYNASAGHYQMMIRPRVGDRSVSMITSKDLKTWSEPVSIFPKYMEGRFQIQYYGMPVFKIDDQFIGLVLRMETPEFKAGLPTGRYAPRLAHSTNGSDWTMEATDFLPAINTESSWSLSEAFDLNKTNPLYGVGGLEATALVEMPDGSYNIYASGFVVDHSLLVRQRIEGTAPTKVLVYNIAKSALLAK